MFRILSTGVFVLQGILFTLVNVMNLKSFRTAIPVDIVEYETLTSSSNAGSYCISGRLEHCFVFLCGILLLSVGRYVPPQDRAIPALGVALGLGITVYSEFQIANGNLDGIEIFQGEFTELIGIFAYVNGVFGFLFALVGFGTLLGYASENTTTTDEKKTN